MPILYDTREHIAYLTITNPGKANMLDRDLELMIAGNRPSAYAKIKVGAMRDGTVTAVDAEVWGTGGNGGYATMPVPYIFTKIPNTRLVNKGIRTNRGGQRAWRAPNPSGA